MLGALALLGGSAVAKSGLDWVKGKINNSAYADRIRDQADLQYAFAERYAKNSPSWNIEGLRRAGLNPILAVSNGVNLGANQPNLSASSPDTDSGNAPDLAGTYQTAKKLDIESANSATSRIGANASMIQAKADASLKQAQAAKVIQDTRFDKEGGGFRNEVVNDLVRASNKGFDSLESYQRSLRERDSPVSYIENSPHDNFRDSLSHDDRMKFDAIESRNGVGSAVHVDRDLRDKYDDFKANKYYHKYRKHRSIITH